MIANVIRSCFPVAAQAVADKSEDINKLNVFPVPDGDTGTNMSLTLGTVVREVAALPADSDMAAVAKAITHGSLMGARGNSGVITSQILRGMAEGLVGAHDPVTADDIAVAFRNSVKVAFKAVRKPVEGTILTVIRDISSRADRCAKEKMGVPEMLEALVVEAYESVARTPDLLPVLKENGVVDSGAYGFATFVEAFVNAALGKTGAAIDFDTSVATASGAHNAADARVAIELNDDWEGSEYRYCNEFLFKAEEGFDPDAALAHLATLGDCELVVGSFPDFKVHVHSNEPNRVLEYMLKYGQVYEVFIHNMDMEAHDRTAGIAADQAAAAKPAEPRKPLGFVAVAAGDGEAEILKSLGVDVVVSGGQTMNPSTADILDAAAVANAESVIVLPNNGNIRMAAEAAASASEDFKIVVVPTKTVPQAFAAMFAVDAEASVEDNAEAMVEAIAEVRDGEVTHAVRDSQAADGTPIHDGDIMGIAGGDIAIVGSDVEQVTLDLINKMQAEQEGDTLTILAGQDMDDERFEALCDRIEDAQPDLEVDAHRGGQPLYPVIFSIE